MAEPTDEPAAELDPFTADLAARGFGIADGLPVNHALRAEALARLGKTEDPAGHITPEFIAAAKETRDALADDVENAATAEARKLRRMNLDALRALALDEVVPLPEDATKAQIVEAIETARAARNEG